MWFDLLLMRFAMFYNYEYTYCTRCHALIKAARVTRGRKGYAFKGFEPILVKTVKGDGLDFGIAWLNRVEIYMPIKLDKHWVAVKFNLINGRIIIYNSLKMETYVHQATTKLTPSAHVLRGKGRSLVNYNCYELGN